MKNKSKSLEEAQERLAIAGSTAWDSQDGDDRKWVRVQLASAQVSATIAVAEALEEMLPILRKIQNQTLPD